MIVQTPSLDPVELLKGALKIYAPATQEAPICTYLVAQMSAHGMRAFRDEAGNAVGIIDPPDAQAQNARELVLLGHMDTVPGFIVVRQKGDKLYGRGAVDARGPLCTFIAAAAATG